MKIQEASKDIQMGGILFPKFRGKLFEDLKTTENWRLGPGNRPHAPSAKMRGTTAFSCFRVG